MNIKSALIVIISASAIVAVILLVNDKLKLSRFKAVAIEESISIKDKSLNKCEDLTHAVRMSSYRVAIDAMVEAEDLQGTEGWRQLKSEAILATMVGRCDIFKESLTHNLVRVNRQITAATSIRAVHDIYNDLSDLLETNAIPSNKDLLQSLEEVKTISFE